MDELISKRSTIEALSEIVDTMSVCTSIDECSGMRLMKALAINTVKNLPSAQPEIIFCKDCIHSDIYPKGADNDMPLKCLGIRYGGVMPDWYCEHAERRA